MIQDGGQSEVTGTTMKRRLENTDKAGDRSPQAKLRKIPSDEEDYLEEIQNFKVCTQQDKEKIQMILELLSRAICDYKLKMAPPKLRKILSFSLVKKWKEESEKLVESQKKQLQTSHLPHGQLDCDISLSEKPKGEAVKLKNQSSSQILKSHKPKSSIQCINIDKLESSEEFDKQKKLVENKQRIVKMIDLTDEEEFEILSISLPKGFRKDSTEKFQESQQSFSSSQFIDLDKEEENNKELVIPLPIDARKECQAKFNPDQPSASSSQFIDLDKEEDDNQELVILLSTDARKECQAKFHPDQPSASSSEPINLDKEESNNQELVIPLSINARKGCQANFHPDQPSASSSEPIDLDKEESDNQELVIPLSINARKGCQANFNPDQPSVSSSQPIDLDEEKDDNQDLVIPLSINARKEGQANFHPDQPSASSSQPIKLDKEEGDIENVILNMFRKEVNQMRAYKQVSQTRDLEQAEDNQQNTKDCNIPESTIDSIAKKSPKTCGPVLKSVAIQDAASTQRHTVTETTSEVKQWAPPFPQPTNLAPKTNRNFFIQLLPQCSHFPYWPYWQPAYPWPPPPMPDVRPPYL